MGHECQKVTCDFRGRKWTAWFATDVPVSDDPWKLCGLPGLVMEAYDKGYQQHFLINGLQQVSDEPIEFGILDKKAKKPQSFLYDRYNKSGFSLPVYILQGCRIVRSEKFHLFFYVGR